MAFSKNIAIVILAAGASSRMGRAKQLLPWENTTLLGNAIRKAKASDANSVTVVLGANAESIRKELPGNQIEIVVNSLWAAGLGSSIACGTDFQIKKECTPNGILFMLADQPLVDTAYLNAMMAAFNTEQHTIIATAYDSRAGVPALFSKDHYEKLAKLSHDFGAKKIIESQDKNTMVLKLGKRILDIDTKTDYENLIKNFK